MSNRRRVKKLVHRKYGDTQAYNGQSQAKSNNLEVLSFAWIIEFHRTKNEVTAHRHDYRTYQWFYYRNLDRFELPPQ